MAYCFPQPKKGGTVSLKKKEELHRTYPKERNPEERTYPENRIYPIEYEVTIEGEHLHSCLHICAGNPYELKNNRCKTMHYVLLQLLRVVSMKQFLYLSSNAGTLKRCQINWKAHSQTVPLVLDVISSVFGVGS
jgi:hypothetical protein